MPEQPKQYIYGPVPSRRLGRSLGVDMERKDGSLKWTSTAHGK